VQCGFDRANSALFRHTCCVLLNRFLEFLRVEERISLLLALFRFRLRLTIALLLLLLLF
jgi:hypothetical protein